MKASGSKIIPLLTSALLVLNGCSSTTVIYTIPEGAKVYVNDDYIGESPVAYSNKKVIGSTNTIKIVKEGYQTMENEFFRSEEFSLGACMGGALTLVPFLWLYDYKSERTYELTANPPVAEEIEEDAVREQSLELQLEPSPSVKPPKLNK